jgi:hypothetical protein
MDENTRDMLRWFFRIDLKDWSNYIAIVVAGFLLWWGLKTIFGTITGAVAGSP